MKFHASVLDEPGGTLVTREFERPNTPVDGALVRVEYSGVCASDLHIVLGDIPGQGYPVSLGHEICGIIEEVGPDFGADVRGVPVTVGSRVAGMPATPCGTCASCRSQSRYPACENYDVLGFSDPYVRPVSGGWGQYVLLSPKARVFVSEAPAANVVLAEPASTPVEGLVRSGFTFGDSVLVQGTGTVGLLAIAAAVFAGASTVAAIGGPPRRLEIARELGASATVDIGSLKDPSARRSAVMEASPAGQGFDHVIECAGVPSTVPEGFGYLKRGGCFIELGHFSDVGEVPLNPYEHMLSRDARMVSSSGYTPDSFARALIIVERLGDLASDLVTHALPLSRADDAVRALQPKNGWKLDGTEVGKIVIDPWKA